MHVSAARYDPHVKPGDELAPGHGQLRSIRFVNVTASSEAPVVLYSAEAGSIHDILFGDYRQTIRESAFNTSLGGNLDLRPVSPDRLGITKYDMAGLTAHGVDNLELSGFDLE